MQNQFGSENLYTWCTEVSVDIPSHPGEDATMLMQTFECITLVKL